MNSNHCSSLEVRGEPLCWACSSGQRLDETGSGRGIDSTQKSITILDKCPRANEHWWKPDILSVLCYKTGKQRNSLFPGALQIVEVSNSRKRKTQENKPQCPCKAKESGKKTSPRTDGGKESATNWKRKENRAAEHERAKWTSISAILRLQGIPLRKSRSEKQHPEKQEEISLLVAFFPGVEIFLRNCPQRDLPLQLIAYN
ncbi:uncharacterized protein LOC125753982 isoform X1 [Canis lupus dingo]|uniref:uncharacterized protein LOC125753982 isoform X1 n=1 Tax=Canis lupus dingo TaxID=286419 RepID=UPI0020C2222F|nr:uncharacterized protein LOC125753982 isoform X1 [Canis lupus dingo]